MSAAVATTTTSEPDEQLARWQSRQRAQGFFRQGWHAMKRHIDKLIQALVFVRLGQQLGTDSELAQAVARGIDLVVSTLSRLFG